MRSRSASLVGVDDFAVDGSGVLSGATFRCSEDLPASAIPLELGVVSLGKGICFSPYFTLRIKDQHFHGAVFEGYEATVLKTVRVEGRLEFFLVLTRDRHPVKCIGPVLLARERNHGELVVEQSFFCR